MAIGILAAIELVLLVVTATLGFSALAGWLRHRSGGLPTAKSAAHITLQLASIGCWIAFIVTGLPALAWTALVIITAGQVAGDLLMFSSYRARHPGLDKPGYNEVARDVLGFTRPVAALHALVGAAAWFGMIGICVAVLLD